MTKQISVPRLPKMVIQAGSAVGVIVKLFDCDGRQTFVPAKGASALVHFKAETRPERRYVLMHVGPCRTCANGVTAH